MPVVRIPPISQKGKEGIKQVMSVIPNAESAAESLWWKEHLHRSLFLEEFLSGAPDPALWQSNITLPLRKMAFFEKPPFSRSL